MRPSNAERFFGPEAGIAIGPILFVVAVLGILAAAIAAGSGSFTSGTGAESNRTKAAAIIQQAENLKVGMDRVIGSQGLDVTSVVISPTSTSATTDLFSPTGGGIAAPSVTMSNDPTADAWIYDYVLIPNLGTGTPGLRVAFLRVSTGVCTELNSKAAGLTSTPAGADVGNISGAHTSGSPLDMTTNWPAALDGKPMGCVNNTNGTTTGRYFYNVLAYQ